MDFHSGAGVRGRDGELPRRVSALATSSQLYNRSGPRKAPGGPPQCLIWLAAVRRQPGPLLCLIPAFMRGQGHATMITCESADVDPPDTLRSIRWQGC